MARPAKSVNLNSKHLTEEERTRRLEAENAMKGEGLPKPPRSLSKEERKIFKKILDILKDSEYIGEIDVYLLTETAITINDLDVLNEQKRIKPELLTDQNFIRAQANAMKNFFRECNELCLSPQSRAKLGVANAKAAEDKGRKTLMDIFNEDDDD